MAEHSSELLLRESDDPRLEAPIVVVGAGLAGLMTALHLAPRPVCLISPTVLGAGASSAWAQGGVAAALGQDDAPETHAADTVAAGSGLVVEDIALQVAREGPDAVRDLLLRGVPFDREASGAFALSLEAAHGKPRVARVKGDLAGRAIMEVLVRAVREAGHIECHEGWSLAALRSSPGSRTARAVIDGVLCRGLEGIREFRGAAVVLATGGVGGLYATTTNPDEAQGIALAAAWQAGARLRDLEFVQFHPTAIDLKQRPAPLATEALRGHGAVLVNTDGRAFMERYHPAGDLAPRDVVARAIHLERQAGRGAALDAVDAIGDGFPLEFPTVFAACQSAGLDPRRQPIPVAPAAHYHMGGIETDAVGRTSLPGLYAVGECASTGLHGANRLASNSLLEALVFARRAAADLRRPPPPSPEDSILPASLPPVLPVQALQEIRTGMDRHVGLVREARGLQEFLERLAVLEARFGMAAPLTVARLMTEAALARQESRGAHFRSDFQAHAAVARHSLTVRARPA